MNFILWKTVVEHNSKDIPSYFLDFFFYYYYYYLHVYRKLEHFFIRKKPSLRLVCLILHVSIYKKTIYMKNVRFTTPIQQLYNNPSHEGGPLYRIKSLYIYIYRFGSQPKNS
jgi:hypothetical protein